MLYRARVFSSAFFFVAVLIGGSSGAFAAAEHETANQREFDALPWAGGTQKLAQSHGSFTVPRSGKMVVGARAARADELINGATSADSEAVAIVAHRTLYLSYHDSGFVTADDWSNVDAASMLKDMTQKTEDENDARVKVGGQALHVDGWVQKPTLDAGRKSVRWVLAMHDSHGRLVNAVALQLGRRGYERFTLASDGTNPQLDAAILSDAAKDYRFDPGFRFSDYVQGDKLAGFGIAALVGTAAGATIAKTVGFGALLLLVKKFFFLILAAFAGGFGYVRRWFKRDRFQVGPPSSPPPLPPAA
jgi:uncharacterized membrane-anchored protein